MGKKLENNGLWEGSRMMLPEHRQALIRQQQLEAELEGKAAESRTPRGRGPRQEERPPTREEWRWAKEAAILPIILDIVENNRRRMEASTQTLKVLYLTAIRVLGEDIRGDLGRLQEKLRNRGIRLEPEEKVDGAIQYCAVCGGQVERIALTREEVRAEVGARLSAYIARMFQQRLDP